MATIEQISQALPDVEANREFQNAVFQFKTGRLPTEADIADITQRAGSNKVKDFANIVLGKESPFAPPENLVSIPQGTAPIQADQLPVGTADLSKILGANIDTSNLDPQVAGLLSLFGKQTEDEKAVEALQTQFTDISKTLGGQGAELQKQLEAQGVPEAFNQVKQLNLRGAQLVGELQQFDVETKRMDAGLENQAIPTGLITGQKAQLEKQRNLKRASIAADLAATSALSQAYAGNATLGQQLAQQAVDIKFQPIINELNVVKDQLGFATDKMTRNDSKRAGIINTLLDIRITELNDQKDLERDINLLAVDAASNGAPIEVVNAMRNAVDLAEATSIGQNFLGQAVNIREEERLAKSALTTSIDSLAAEAATNGASQEIINAMRNAVDLADAARIGQKFLPGTFPTVSGGEIGDITEVSDIGADLPSFEEFVSSKEQELQQSLNIDDPALFDEYSKFIIDNAPIIPQTEEQFKNSTSLRKEFVQNSKEFILQRNAFNRIEASATDPSAAGDLALIFNFMKVLDPGSTVREGEFANAQNSGSIPSVIVAQYNNIIAGERLSETQRADFFDRAQRIFNSSNIQQNQLINTYTGLSERAGLDPKNVVIDLSSPAFLNATDEENSFLNSF